MSVNRLFYGLAGGAGCLLVLAGAGHAGRQRLVLNTTASVAPGFYWVVDGPPTVGELVVVRPPWALARWMARRRYLPANVPLIKRVAATAGSTICGRAGVMEVDGEIVARARSVDHWGRPLIPYQGCVQLGAEDVLLLNTDAPDSLDGRYFGPLPRSVILGRARPLWTWAR